MGDSGAVLAGRADGVRTPAFIVENPAWSGQCLGATTRPEARGTHACPEHITITDNAIIPLKERVADRFYDPVMRILRALFGKKKAAKQPASEAVAQGSAEAK